MPPRALFVREVLRPQRHEHGGVGVFPARRELLMPLVHTPPASDAAANTSPPGHMQNVYALDPSGDTFEMLHAQGVPMEPKPFSMGVRIEHRHVGLGVVGDVLRRAVRRELREHEARCAHRVCRC